MKPVIDISDPVVQKFAAIALFEQMQKVFNLSPASMAHAFNLLARQKSVAPLQLVSTVKAKVQALLETCLQDTVALVEGRSIVSEIQSDREVRDLQLHFNLDSVLLATGIMDRVKREVSPEEAQGAALRVVLWVRENAETAFDWAFAQTEHILRTEAEQEDE